MEAPKRKYQKHKTSVKITVKHQLNTNAKPDIDAITEERIYPIYVTVSVNGQFTRFKSRLRQSVAPDKLDNLLNMPEHKAFAENELRTIEDSIREFKPGSKKEFKLTDWSKYYLKKTAEISAWINFYVDDTLLDILQHRYNWSNEQMLQLPTDIRSRFAVVTLLGIPEADKLFEQARVVIDLDIYETVIRISHKHNHLYCLWDCLSGYYQQQISNLLGDKAAPIVKEIDRMKPMMADC